MKHVILNEALSLYFDTYFPYKAQKRSDKRFRVVVGIGGNIGDTRARFKKLFFYFQKQRRVDVVETSPILQNPPFGYTEQKDFFNAVMVLQTNMYPEVFLRYLLHVEKVFQRERFFPNSPRTLDLDIVFFDTIRYKSKHLIIPHPAWQNRPSVVIPLSYIGL